MKYLIISAVGDDSLHREWIAGQPEFDLCLIYYGNSDQSAAEFSEQCRYFIRSRGMKFHLVRKFIDDNTELIRSYSYIWLPDNDISISTNSINTLFRIAEEKQLLLCQPAMTGYISHKITKPKSWLLLRYTNFVEVLAPLMSQATLLQLNETFQLNYSGWGFDYLWPYLLGYPNNKIAIIDAVIIEHTKPIGADYSRFPKHPKKEMREILKSYAPGIKKEIIVYSKVLGEKSSNETREE